jgi:hypothetical protein
MRARGSSSCRRRSPNGPPASRENTPSREPEQASSGLRRPITHRAVAGRSSITITGDPHHYATAAPSLAPTSLLPPTHTHTRPRARLMLGFPASSSPVHAEGAKSPAPHSFGSRGLPSTLVNPSRFRDGMVFRGAARSNPQRSGFIEPHCDEVGGRGSRTPIAYRRAGPPFEPTKHCVRSLVAPRGPVSSTTNTGA